MDGNQLQAYLNTAGLDNELHRDVSAPLDVLLFHEAVILSESELLREQILRAIEDMSQIDMAGSSRNE